MDIIKLLIKKMLVRLLVFVLLCLSLLLAAGIIGISVSFIPINGLNGQILTAFVGLTIGVIWQYYASK